MLEKVREWQYTNQNSDDSTLRDDSRKSIVQHDLAWRKLQTCLFSAAVLPLKFIAWTCSVFMFKHVCMHPECQDGMSFNAFMWKTTLQAANATSKGMFWLCLYTAAATLTNAYQAIVSSGALAKWADFNGTPMVPTTRFLFWMDHTEKWHEFMDLPCGGHQRRGCWKVFATT